MVNVSSGSVLRILMRTGSIDHVMAVKHNQPHIPSVIAKHFQVSVFHFISVSLILPVMLGIASQVCVVIIYLPVSE